MNRQSTDQLEKVLALADSSHDGEAVVAVRKARQLLSRDGLNFGDLARAAGRPQFPIPFFSAAPRAQLEIQLVRMRQELQELQADREMLAAQTEFWRARADELKRNLSQVETQAKRWQDIARDTVEKLWALGQSIQNDDETKSS